MVSGTPITSRMSRTLALLFVIIIAGSTLAACEGNDEALVIYSGRSEALVGPLIEQFVDETGIDADVRYGSSADLALLISEEGDRSPADIFFSQSPGAVGFLAERELLARLSEGLLDRVDPRLRNDSGLWVGITGRQRVLVYNEELVEPSELPASVFDLTDEQYRGRVALAPENSSFQDFVTAMRHLQGEAATAEWLSAMGENDARVYASNSAIVEAVGRGEVPFGLVNHYYNYRFLAEDPALRSRNHLFSGGDVGALLMAAAATVLVDSDQPANAERFIEYLLSQEGQDYFATETFEYPLVRGVEPSGALPALESLSIPDYDIEELGGGLRQTAILIAESGLVR